MAKPADGEAFRAEVKEICDLYEAAPELEKSGILKTMESRGEFLREKATG